MFRVRPRHITFYCFFFSRPNAQRKPLLPRRRRARARFSVNPRPPSRNEVPAGLEESGRVGMRRPFAPWPPNRRCFFRLARDPAGRGYDDGPACFPIHYRHFRLNARLWVASKTGSQNRRGRIDCGGVAPRINIRLYGPVK